MVLPGTCFLYRYGVDMMKNLITRFSREEKGQDLIEYSFLAVFIALVVTAALTVLGTSVNTAFSNIAAQVLVPSS